MTSNRTSSTGILEKTVTNHDLDESLLKFCRLLAFIETPIVPKLLFDRACRIRVIWTESGEPGSTSPNQNRVPSWLIRLLHSEKGPSDAPGPLLPAIQRELLSVTREDSLLEYYCLNEKWRNPLRTGVPLSGVSCLFDIVAIVLQAFPESHTEIIWEEVEHQLWDVIETTVLPFISILDVKDIVAEISSEHIRTKVCFVTTFLRFLCRMSDILGDNAPPSIAILHRATFHFACDLVSVHSRSIPATINSVPTSSGLEYYAPQAEQDHRLEHHVSERLNAAFAFLLAGATLEHLPRALHAASSWFPVSRGKPSTMETVALGSVHGVSTVVELFRIFLHSLPLQFNILLGFYAIKQQSFEIALDILESNKAAVADFYGVTSMEHLITGIELVKCHNFMLEEIKGESLARNLWSDIFGLEDGRIKVTSLYQTYLATVLSDSFIGQAKYDEAGAILLEILECPMASNDIIVSSAIRLLKMSRRQRTERPTFDVWDILEKAVSCIDEVNENLKYECVEEAMCHISVLEDDPTQITRAESVVIALSRYSFEHYSGSKTSKQNLKDHMLALQGYRKWFKLFSVSGPQLHFSRLIRDGFPSASISFIERIGTTNWNRFNRVKDLPLRANIITDEAYSSDGKSIGPSDSIFTDSALGSSLQTASKARSRISYQSLGSVVASGLDNFPPMPEGVPKGKPFECPICCKRLRGISTAAQWENHVYADLQPYTCIVDSCSSGYTTFGSRAEFTAHLVEHQNVCIRRCKACDYATEGDASMREHIAIVHPGCDLKLITESTLNRRNLAEEQCPFCGDIPGARFIGHVCRHLEEIALTVLPKEVEWDSGSDEGDDASRLLEHLGVNLATEDNLEDPTASLKLRCIYVPPLMTWSAVYDIFATHGPLKGVFVDSVSKCFTIHYDRVESAISAKRRMDNTELFPGAGLAQLSFTKPQPHAPQPLEFSRPGEFPHEVELAKFTNLEQGEDMEFSRQYTFNSVAAEVSVPTHQLASILPCAQCRRLQTKCNGQLPCSHCKEFVLPCGYAAEPSLGNVVSLKGSHSESTGSYQRSYEYMFVSSEAGTFLEQSSESIQDIQVATKCNIELSPHDPQEAERKIGFVGSVKAVQAAQMAIKEHVNQLGKQNRHGAGRLPTIQFGSFTTTEDPDLYGHDPSKAGSESGIVFKGLGGDGGDSDQDPSNASTRAHPSTINVKVSSPKKTFTLEEREAAYQKARNRIFGKYDPAVDVAPDPSSASHHFSSSFGRPPLSPDLGNTKRDDALGFQNDVRFDLRQSEAIPGIDLRDPLTSRYNEQLIAFIGDGSRQQFTFLPAIPEHRGIIHTLAHHLGLDHYTVGEGFNCRVQVSRKEREPLVKMQDPPNKLYWGQLTQLMSDTSRDELIFPPQDSEHRRIIHIYAEQLGLEHSSYGDGDNRYIRVSRKRQEPFLNSISTPQSQGSTKQVGQSQATYPNEHPYYTNNSFSPTYVAPYNAVLPGQTPIYTPLGANEAPPLGLSRLGSDGQVSTTHHPYYSHSNPYPTVYNPQPLNAPGNHSANQPSSQLPPQQSQIKTGQSGTNTGGWEPAKSDGQGQTVQAQAQPSLNDRLASLQETETRAQQQLREQRRASNQYQAQRQGHPDNSPPTAESAAKSTWDRGPFMSIQNTAVSPYHTQSDTISNLNTAGPSTPTAPHQSNPPTFKAPPSPLSPDPSVPRTKPRRSAAITIKKPDGTPLDIDAALQVPLTYEELQNAGRRGPWHCANCRMEFLSSYNYDKHRKDEHRSKWFSCGVRGCEKFFFKKENRDAHERRDHGRLGLGYG